MDVRNRMANGTCGCRLSDPDDYMDEDSASSVSLQQ